MVIRRQHVDDWSVRFLTHFFNAKRSFPERLAVIDHQGNRKTTYREYVSVVNALGAELLERGIKPGQVVAIDLGRVMEHHAARIACFAVGAVFVSLSPALPEARRATILEDSGAGLVIDDNFVARALSAHQDAPECLNINLRDTDPGFIVFTSGTTGKPKGMLHDRTIFCMLACVLRDIYAKGLGIERLPLERVFFDVIGAGHYTHAALCDPTVVMSMFDTLETFGVTVHLIDPALLRDAAGLVGYLKMNQINTTIAVPGLLNALAPHITFDCVVIAGDMNRFDFSKLEHTYVANVYGASECPIMGWGDARQNNQVRPLLPGSTFDVADDGALTFTGPGILREYVNDAGRASNAVRTLPSGQRVLDTGDAALACEDGRVEVRGRMDNTVKLRGNRVALEEVEAALGTVPGVMDAAACPDPHNPDCLRALYTCAPGATVDEGAFAATLAQKLPAYMVPVTFTQVEAFQKTLSGKIVRASLPALLEAALGAADADAASAAADAAASADAPDTVTAVMRVFSQVLGNANVGPDDDFMRLGGDSLRAMALQQQLTRTFGVHLSANRILDLATPRALAAAIENPGPDELPQVDKLAYSFADRCPLTESQWNIYLGSGTSATQTSTRYNLPFDLLLGQGFTHQDVQGIIDYLVQRHPVLKGRVELHKNIPHLIYDLQPQVACGTPEDAEDFVAPFDLTQGVMHALYVQAEDGAHLFLDIHHIVCDGTSLSLLARDIATAVQMAGLAKQENTDALANSRMNLLGSDDAADEGMLRQLTFEAAVADTPAYAAAKAFFNEMLADAAETPTLLDSPNKDGHHRTLYAPFAKLEDAAAFACSQGITLNQLFGCAFAYTLAEFTGGKQAAFSVIEDGRGTLDLGKSVGMFTRTVPVLINCEDQPVGQFLTAGADIIAKALSYDFYPLRLIVTATSANTDIQFQYSHGIHEYGGTSLGSIGYTYIKEKSMPACDLSFEVLGDEGQVRVIIEHSDRYSVDLAASMEATFEQVLTQMMTAERLKQIQPLPPTQRGWLDAANQTEHAYPVARVMDAVQHAFATHPARPFLKWDGGTYTYAQGALLVNAVHDAALQAAGNTKPDNEPDNRDGGFCQVSAKEDDQLNLTPHSGTRAAVVFTGRNHLFPLAAWGALTAGLIYVPVEPDHPDDRIAYVTEDVDAAVVLVDNSTAERAQRIVDSLENAHPTLVNVQAIEAKLAADGALQDAAQAKPDKNLRPHCQVWDDEDVMCILYTSGTTGKPKGVEIPHRAFVNVAQNYIDITHMTCEDIYSLYTPLSFDMHTLCLFCSVFVGACINVVPSDIRLDLATLDHYFQLMGTTHVCMTTHVGKLFVSKGLGRSLEHLLVIGETLGEFTAPDKPIMWESYGPTESLALITQIPVNERTHSSSVGHLYRNVQTYLLDREGRRSPVGAVGELCIGGAQLAQGYRNRPEQTAAAFVSTEAITPGQALRLYRSGDVARYLPDTTLGFLGRNDDQVKIRGNRVELSEVEDAIAALPWVKDVVCIAVKHDAFKELAAYVVLDAQSEQAALDDAQVFSLVTGEVKAKKPAYMVPAYVVRLEALPVNANGKVARRFLPAPTAAAQQAGYVEPTTQEQRILCEVFEVVLGASQVGINDDFIRLGGDSVGAMKAAWELSERGLECKAFTILENRTPAAIAQALEAEGISVVAPGGEDGPDVENAAANANIRLGWHHDDGTFEGLLTPTLMNFYENEVNKGMGSAYVFLGVCPCPPGTTPDQAHDAVATVIAEHPALRARIDTREGEVCFVDGGVPQVESKSLATQTMEEIQAELSTPFALDQALSRFYVVDAGPATYVAFAAHHLISDALSVALTIRLLLEALAANAAGAPVQPNKDWAFISVVNQRLVAAASGRYQNAQAYFEDALDQQTVEAHALGLTRQLGEGEAGVLCVAAPGVRAAVDDYLQRSGLTLGALGHAIFAHVLTRFADQPTSIYKTGIHGRYTPAAQEGIGCMAEFTVVCNPHAASLDETLASALEDSVNVVERSIYPYKMLKDRYPNITYLPFFEYVPQRPTFDPPRERKLDCARTLWSGQLPAADGNVIADFTGMLHDFEDGLAFVIEHSSKYPRAQLEALCADFFETLLDIVEQPPATN